MICAIPLENLQRPLRTAHFLEDHWDLHLGKIQLEFDALVLNYSYTDVPMDVLDMNLHLYTFKELNIFSKRYLESITVYQKYFILMYLFNTK